MLLSRELPTYLTIAFTGNPVKTGRGKKKIQKSGLYDNSYEHVDGNYADTYLPAGGNTVLQKYRRDDCNLVTQYNISCNDCNFDSVMCCADLVQSFLLSVQAL